jgi:regulator of sigma E protease
VILLIAVVAAVIVLIIRNIEATKNILLVLLGFGSFVIVHEFGHFIVAKLCGIKVEVFSIFMPPTLLGIKKADRGWRIRVLPEMFGMEARDGQESKEGDARLAEDGESRREEQFSITIGKKILPGETEYRIGLIPFGGFVKMLGQEDVGPVKESKDPRSFANKPALVRAAVLAAGVAFNVISAVVLYVIVFLVGVGLPGPIVGGVVPGSPAAKAGIRPGDEVIEVAGEDGRLDFSDVFTAGVLSGKGQEVPMKIRHVDGAIEDVKLVAEQLPGGKFREFGIGRAYSLTIAKLVPEDANILEKTTGLMPGDRIKAIAGVDVNSHWEFEQIVGSTFEPNVVLLAERRDASGQAQLIEARLGLEFAEPRFTGREEEKDLSNICGMVPRIRIVGVTRTFKQRLLERFGFKDRTNRLKKGDIISAVGNIENPTYSEMRELTKEYKDKTLSIAVIRNEPNGVQQRLMVEVVPKENKDIKRVMIGLAVELEVEHPVVAKTIATPQQQEALTIPRGATITAIDGVEVSSFYDIARELKKNAGQRITIDWRIDEQNAGNAAIEVGRNEQVVTALAVPKQIVPFRQLERVYKAEGLVDAVRMGYKRTKIFIIQTYITLQRLIGGLVSPKELMGPVGILAFSYRIVADQPFIYYVYFLGLISASIAVLNFLPLPPLDGGLTLLLLVEKIKGSALSIRTQEIIAYAGWGLVGAFFLYVTFNDIARIIFG